MHRITLTIPAMVAGLFLSADGPEGDIERLQGTWVMVSLEIDGLERPEEVATSRLTVEGNRYQRQAGGKTYPETFTVDPDQRPKAIDFTYTDGPRKGVTVKGIYKLEVDRWVICKALLAEGERPKEFVTRAKSDRAMVVWKRVRPPEGAKR